MKKLLAIALTTLTITSLAPMSANAEENKTDCGYPAGKGMVFTNYNGNLDELKSKLESLGIPLNNCPAISLPGGQCGMNGNCSLPNFPEIDTPDIDVPETPDTNAPDTEVPDTPDTETPDDDPSQASFAGQVVRLVNEERAKAGLPALTIDRTVEKAALARAKETEVSFSHTRPNGSSFSTVLGENGVSYRGAGENIAWGQKTPEEVMNGWMNSPGHKANILNKSYTTIGVGYYQNAKGVNYWTQLFTY